MEAMGHDTKAKSGAGWHESETRGAATAKSVALLRVVVLGRRAAGPLALPQRGLASLRLVREAERRPRVREAGRECRALVEEVREVLDGCGTLSARASHGMQGRSSLFCSTTYSLRGPARPSPLSAAAAAATASSVLARERLRRPAALRPASSARSAASSAACCAIATRSAGTAAQSAS
jgi:hypothetical protein